MQRRRLAALFFAIAIAITLPTIAFAAVNTTGAGLVPCGVSSEFHAATECEACNLVQLIQNVIMFLIGLSIPIAMGMFAYAGFLYFSSGIGGSENISKAKKIFSSSLFGFALAVAAWLIVNTLLFTVLDHEQYPNSSWFHIDCSSLPRVVDRDLGSVLGSHLGAAPPVTEQKYVPVYSCSAGFELGTVNGVQVCVNDQGKKQSPTVVQTFAKGSGVVCDKRNGACSPEALVRAGVSQARANTMSCIAITESSGNPGAINKSGGACGTFQILPSNWKKSVLHSGNCNSSVSCNNAECNMQAAIALGNNRKSSGQSYYADWTCPGCNSKASACVAKYDPGN